MKTFLCAIVIVVSGCAATGDVIRTNMYEGMPKGEVLTLLGKPDGYQRSGNYEALRYMNRRMRGISDLSADYTIILKDGLVTEYGPGQVQRPNTGMLVLLPIQ